MRASPVNRSSPIRDLNHIFSLRRVEKLSALAVLIGSVKRMVKNWWTMGNAPISQADNPSATLSGILSVAFSVLWCTRFCFHKLISPFHLSWQADSDHHRLQYYTYASSDLPHLLTLPICLYNGSWYQGGKFTRLVKRFITKAASQIYCDGIHKWQVNSVPVVFTWRTSWWVSAVYLHFAVAWLNKGHVENCLGFTCWLLGRSARSKLSGHSTQTLHLGSCLWLPGGKSLCFEISYSEAEWVTKHHKVKKW